MLEHFGLHIQRDEGQTLVEYALILATISIGVIVVMGLLRNEIAQTFSNIISAL
jgi:Flp pilus assembly pilin Flp